MATYNVVGDFGAVAGGSASTNKTAFVSAFSALSDGHSVLVPTGTYDIDASGDSGYLFLDGDGTLYGEGTGSVLNFSRAASDGTGIYLNSGASPTLRDFKITGTNTTTGFQAVFHAGGTATLTTDSLTIASIYNGIKLDAGAVAWTDSGSSVTTSNLPLLAVEGGTTTHSLVLEDTTFSSSGAHATYINTGVDFLLRRVTFSAAGSGSYGLHCFGGGAAHATRRILDACTFGSGLPIHAITGIGCPTYFRDCTFALSDNGISARGKVHMRGCTFTGSGASAVYDQSSTAFVTAAGCTFSGSCAAGLLYRSTVHSGRWSFRDCTFSNSASSIYRSAIAGGTAYFEDCTFSQVSGDLMTIQGGDLCVGNCTNSTGQNVRITATMAPVEVRWFGTTGSPVTAAASTKPVTVITG